MPKKMTSYRIDTDVIELLKLVAKKENRSQGNELEYLVKKEAARLNIKIDDKQA